MENFSLVNSHSLLGNPLILPQIQILISFWSQKTEKQKFDIKENVMSELVKMPVRHFLRSDYLHIFFYIKFLLFVSLVQQISIYNDSCNVVSIDYTCCGHGHCDDRTVSIVVYHLFCCCKKGEYVLFVLRHYSNFRDICSKLLHFAESVDNIRFCWCLVEVMV